MFAEKKLFSLVPFALASVTLVNCARMPLKFDTNRDTYLEKRKLILNQEKDIFSGGTTVLSEKEKVVNNKLLKLKKIELEDAYRNCSSFLPSKNFLLAKKDIEESRVFKFLKAVPKGGSLHTHFLAGVSANFIIEDLSYEENVYGCYINSIFKLKILENPKHDSNYSWKSLKQYRKENPLFDNFLLEKLVLNITSVSLSKEEIWPIFKNTFSTIYDLVSHRPTFRKYVYRLLEELWMDNVMYTELRGTFMPLYDLNGTTHGTKVFIETFLDVINEFKSTHVGFVGVKYIFCVYRGVDNTTLKTAMEELILYTNMYPDFIAGFDFVGNEDEGRNLVDFHEELIAFGKDVKYFFHAGETTRFGNIDLNLADAIMLNSSRIGHGFALAKHPVLLELARQRDIPIELCPISNQVLKLHDDPRTHPATTLLARGYPVVVGNDDPSAWDATGLSYDWYHVFMAMTREDAGLGFLKKLALDSITYSAMKDRQKQDALEKWQGMWNTFLNNIINEC